MRIGIDGRPLQGRLTGIGRYVAELCKELDKLLPNAQFYIYTNRDITFTIPSSRWFIRRDPIKISNRIPSVLWVKFREGMLASRDNIDVFWAAGIFIPFFLTRQIKTIITVYDLNHKIVPETIKTTHCWSIKMFFRSTVRRADCITAISKGTSNRLFEFYKKRADEIIRPSVDSQFFPPSKEEINAVLQQQGISQPYLLAVGTLEPRKNLHLLIDVFIDLKNKGFLQNHNLVLVGATGWKLSEFGKRIKEKNSSQIITLGYVENNLLRYLYAGSDVFVFPSIYEGFGMPVLEALRCGAKVLASNVAEIREAGGDHPNILYVDAMSKDISDGILKLTKPSKSNFFSFSTPTWHEGAEKLANRMLSLLEKE